MKEPILDTISELYKLNEGRDELREALEDSARKFFAFAMNIINEND